jgi:hypothetical protein
MVGPEKQNKCRPDRRSFGSANIGSMGRNSGEWAERPLVGQKVGWLGRNVVGWAKGRSSRANGISHQKNLLKNKGALDH